MKTLYILSYLGLMCFDGIKRDFFNLECNQPLKEAAILSERSCATLNDKAYPYKEMMNVRLVETKYAKTGRAIPKCE